MITPNGENKFYGSKQPAVSGLAICENLCHLWTVVSVEKPTHCISTPFIRFPEPFAASPEVYL